MRHITPILFSILLWTTSSVGQTQKSCFEIKYLDFFGVENLDTIKWTTSELDQILKADLAKDENEKKRKKNFLSDLFNRKECFLIFLNFNHRIYLGHL